MLVSHVRNLQNLQDQGAAVDLHEVMPCVRWESRGLPSPSTRFLELHLPVTTISTLIAVYFADDPLMPSFEFDWSEQRVRCSVSGVYGRDQLRCSVVQVETRL